MGKGFYQAADISTLSGCSWSMYSCVKVMFPEASGEEEAHGEGGCQVVALGRSHVGSVMGDSLAQALTIQLAFVVYGFYGLIELWSGKLFTSIVWLPAVRFAAVGFLPPVVLELARIRRDRLEFASGDSYVPSPGHG